MLKGFILSLRLTLSMICFSRFRLTQKPDENLAKLNDGKEIFWRMLCSIIRPSVRRSAGK